MALDSYALLQAAVAQWLDRDDLTDRIPDFIALGEARLARDLRLRRMLTRAVLSTTAGTATVSLPSDWLHTARVRLVAPDMALDQLGPTTAGTYRADESGAPRRYTVEGSGLRLFPTPDSAYSIELLYYARIPALSAQSTNWLLSESPSLYLFAALAEGALYIASDERAPIWDARYRSDLKEVCDADERANVSGSRLRIRAR